jgi:hypothetical protein
LSPDVPSENSANRSWSFGVSRFSQAGLKDNLTGIVLIAAEVAKQDVTMQVGASSQTVTVTGAAPLLDAETSSVAATLETTAVEDLPLSATGGQDALNLALITTPSTVGSNGTDQAFISIVGQPALANSVYLNGVESTTGLQGNSATPSRDALREIQLMINVADAEFGTGTAEIFQIKSETKQFHGTAFESKRTASQHQRVALPALAGSPGSAA